MTHGTIMLAAVRTAALEGIKALPVIVEVHTQGGPQRFSIIGLADNAIRESRDRISSALVYSGFHLPNQVLVSLSPAEVKKEGSSFDLPIALGILAASHQLRRELLEGVSFFGELALDGSVRSVRGIVPLVLDEAARKTKKVVVPRSNLREAQHVTSLHIEGAATLLTLCERLKGRRQAEVIRKEAENNDVNETRSLAEVRGQEHAKRALCIAAAGAHNLLLLGPPGCGKSMLAERLPHLLPPLEGAEQLEVLQIHSIAGKELFPILSGVRPFRAPHHVISDVGLVGGGASPRPGEISLAHRGVLFLDEFPEFKRTALEAMRAPLENGRVSIARAKSSVEFPATFQLIAAMNPCPCGNLGRRDKRHGSACRCSRAQIETYLKKLSGPLLDRIDIQVELEPVDLKLLVDNSVQEIKPDDGIERSRIAQCRARQYERQGRLNSQLRAQQLLGSPSLLPEARELLKKQHEKQTLSARGAVKLLRVARTIADYDERDEITAADLAEASGFRALGTIQSYIQGGWQSSSP